MTLIEKTQCQTNWFLYTFFRRWFQKLIFSKSFEVHISEFNVPWCDWKMTVQKKSTRLVIFIGLCKERIAMMTLYELGCFSKVWLRLPRLSLNSALRLSWRLVVYLVAAYHCVQRHFVRCFWRSVTKYARSCLLVWSERIYHIFAHSAWATVLGVLQLLASNRLSTERTKGISLRGYSRRQVVTSSSSIHMSSCRTGSHWYSSLHQWLLRPLLPLHIQSVSYPVPDTVIPRTFTGSPVTTCLSRSRIQWSSWTVLFAWSVLRKRSNFVDDTDHRATKTANQFLCPLHNTLHHVTQNYKKLQHCALHRQGHGTRPRETQAARTPTRCAWAGQNQFRRSLWIAR